MSNEDMRPIRVPVFLPYEPVDASALTQMAEMLQQAMQSYKAFIQSFAEQQKRFAETVKPLVEGIEKCVKLLPIAVDHISEAGWTFPPHMGLGTVAWLAEASNNDIDQAFLDFYEDKDAFLEVVDQIKYCIHDGTKKMAFDECVRAYSLQMYIVSANTLIPILEGKLASFSADPNCIWMKGLCSAQLNQQKVALAFAWKSMKAFIDHLYQESKFAETEPASINRHRQVHGRFSRPVTKMDCLRLINALSTICELSAVDKSSGTVILPRDS